MEFASKLIQGYGMEFAIRLWHEIVVAIESQPQLKLFSFNYGIGFANGVKLKIQVSTLMV